MVQLVHREHRLLEVLSTKMEAAKVQNVNAGLKHSMVKACQKVRGDGLTAGERGCGDIITVRCVYFLETVRSTVVSLSFVL